MLKLIPALCIVIVFGAEIGSAQATVHVTPPNLQGPRVLEERTAAAVIRNYLQSWQSLRVAMEQNRADALDSAFVGTAKEKLAVTIQQQAKLGIRTSYNDRDHDIQIVFYSPEGLSVELIDTVQYDVQIVDRNKVVTTQRATSKYVVVLTPAELRWRVRVFQSMSE